MTDDQVSLIVERAIASSINQAPRKHSRSGPPAVPDGYGWDLPWRPTAQGTDAAEYVSDLSAPHPR